MGLVERVRCHCVTAQRQTLSLTVKGTLRLSYLLEHCFQQTLHLDYHTSSFSPFEVKFPKSPPFLGSPYQLHASYYNIPFIQNRHVGTHIAYVVTVALALCLQSIYTALPENGYLPSSPCYLHYALPARNPESVLHS